MITNEHQYKVTKRLALELEEALRVLPRNKEFHALHSKGQQAHLSSLKAQLVQHKAELREYESLKDESAPFVGVRPAI